MQQSRLSPLWVSYQRSYFWTQTTWFWHFSNKLGEEKYCLKFSSFLCLPNQSPVPITECRQWECRYVAFWSSNLLCSNSKLHSKVKSNLAVVCSLSGNIFVSVLGASEVSIFSQGCLVNRSSRWDYRRKIIAFHPSACYSRAHSFMHRK